MLLREFISESRDSSTQAVAELARRLPDLRKHTYSTIDRLMREICKTHGITPQALHDAFVKRYKKIPDDWIKDKIQQEKRTDEGDVVLANPGERDLTNNATMRKFIDYCCELLKLTSVPQIEFSFDTMQARRGHHTGRYDPHDDKIWIYCANRNMVDICRTVAHELRHYWQREHDLIKPGSNRPGSDVEVDADAWAGIQIKLFGKKNREIFESRHHHKK